MIRDKILFATLVFTFLAIIMWTSYSMNNDEKEEESYRISVIVNDSNNDRWIALRQGLEQAAKDCNADLNYVSTGRLESAEEEIALINRELENGAQGIIVQMITSEENVMQMMNTTVKPALMLLESDIKPENQYGLAGPDNREIGRAAADAVKRDFDKEIDGKRIGILSGNHNRLSMQQRLEGLKEGLEDVTVTIAWEHSHGESMDEEYLEQFEQLEPVDILIALENDETERMVDFMLEQPDSEEENDTEDVEKLCLYGVGYSEKAVYYLDKGVITTLVVPNEFNLGYQSMKSVVNQLKYHLDKAEDSQIDYLVIDSVNMYDEENQKVLFPIVQ